LRNYLPVAAWAIAFAAILAVAGGATAGSNPNGPRRDGNHGHWFKRACDVPGSHRAACDAQVVTNSDGLPMVTNTTPSGYGPDQFHGAYSLPDNAPGTPTIGIVDAFDDPNIEADLAAYSTQYNLPACTTANGCFRKVNQTGGSTYPAADAGWALEIALDVQTAHAICKNCKILLVEATTNSMTNLGLAENEAVSLGASVVSNSWGGSEFSAETSIDSSYFNHPGVVITASSGDGGYGVEYPAASRYVTAVGGTTLSVNASTNAWASETAWSGAGSGCSAYESKPGSQSDASCTRRTVADVSADADPNTGAAVYDSVTYQGQSGWFQVGGTSLASPLIASVYALTGTTSSANYGSTPYSHTSSLHDVTAGSNGSCGGSYLCTATPGYDGPTGLGTPNGLTAFTAGAPAPDFSVSASPSSRTVTQGTNATYTVTVGALNGFTGTVALSQTGLPGSAAATFSPASITGSGTSTLTVTTGSVPAGTYPFTITGKSGALTHSVSATLVVQAGQSGDFAISVSPTSATIARNSTTTYTVTIAPQNGFGGAVSLSATDTSAGLTESFSPDSATSTSTLTVRASGLRRNRHFTVTITGTSGSLSHSATLSLST
jgi:subtilase family serine protease